MAQNKADSNRTASRARTTVTKSSAVNTGNRSITIKQASDIKPSSGLTPREKKARMIKKYATTSFGFNMKTAFDSYGSGDTIGSQHGNFYSPQLSTDFLEKPQNMRERRAWYRHFYHSNEFVAQAIDLHSQLPLSKVRLEKPKCKNHEYSEYVYDFFLDMCNDVKLFKSLMEISHEYNLLGNCVTGDSKLRTPEGYKRAEDIKVGDKVLTDRGRWRSVEKTCSRKAEKILKIQPWRSFRPLRVSEEHPIEVIRNGKVQFIPASEIEINDYLRVTWPTIENNIESKSIVDFDEILINEEGYEITSVINRKKSENSVKARRGIVSWLQSIDRPVIRTRSSLANDMDVPLSCFDSTVMALDREVDSPFHRILGPKGYQKGSQVEWIPGEDFSGIDLRDNYDVVRVHKYRSPKEILINENFCYLVGYWISDGTLSRDSKRNSWGRGLWQISFGDTSERQYRKIYTIMEKMLGKNCIKTWENRGMRYLKVKSNPAFIEWWDKNFGGTSKGSSLKRIPQWFLELPKEKLKHFVSGVMDSGGTACDGENAVASIGMVSESLIDSIRDISLKCGIVFNSRVGRTRECKLPQGNFIKSSEMYYLYSYNKESCERATEYSIKKFSNDSEFSEPKYIYKNGDLIGYKVRRIEEEKGEVVYNFQVEEDHTYQVNGISTHNCFIFAEDHDPYSNLDDDEKAGKKEKGKEQAKFLKKEYNIVDKDPNYLGWRKLVILPPDQVRLKKVPLSDESFVEFIPDPETRKMLLKNREGGSYDNLYPIDPQLESGKYSVPEKIVNQLEQNGTVPLDTDPYSGSHVFHLARKKSQYETWGVSILERCINTLLFSDKIRQAQTQIASRHMTPIRIVWAEELSETDVDNLREQVDLALVDPDFSIVANYQVNWEEMGSNGRLLELSTEYEHIENSLFAGLGVTREILTGEGTYAGNRITLEILNTLYLLFREVLQEYVENYLFKPIAKKKGFIEVDKFGREKLIYPKLSFTRLAIRDNDAFFDQAFQLYQKGSISIDVILEMLNIDPESTKRKIEADLFTVNDPAFNNLMINTYTTASQPLVDQYDVLGRLAEYLKLPENPTPPEGEGEGLGGLGGAGGLGGETPRFASRKAHTLEGLKKLAPKQDAALKKLVQLASTRPDKLDKIFEYLSK